MRRHQKVKTRRSAPLIAEWDALNWRCVRLGGERAGRSNMVLLPLIRLGLESSSMVAHQTMLAAFLQLDRILAERSDTS